MSKRQIVNIINFIRGVEPRMDMDLITPVREQIRLIITANHFQEDMKEMKTLRDAKIPFNAFSA